MSGIGLLRQKSAAIIATGTILSLVFAIIPTPTQALSGEQVINFHTEFTITYNDTSGSDFIWWDWQVIGKKANITFTIKLTEFHTTQRMAYEGDGTIIHKEISFGSSGHIRLSNNYYKTIAKWTCSEIENVTLRYNVRLNPPDLNSYYLIVIVLLMLPPTGLFIVILYNRSRKIKVQPIKAL